MDIRNVIAACCLLVAGAATITADVIPPDQHPVARCITITNLDEFPDISIIGGIVPVSKATTVERYIVKPDSCLTKGYKFNSFYLFWVEKTYLEELGLENLPLKELLPSAAKRKVPIVAAPRIGLISTLLEPDGGTIPDSIPTVREDLKYQLITVAGSDELSFFLSEKITTDSSGNETRSTFEQPVGLIDIPQSTVAPSRIVNARIIGGYLLFSPLFDGATTASLIDCHGRTVLRFSKECRSGHTYHIRTTGLSGGMYWLRVKSAGTTPVTVPIHRFR